MIDRVITINKYMNDLCSCTLHSNQENDDQWIKDDEWPLRTEDTSVLIHVIQVFCGCC